MKISNLIGERTKETPSSAQCKSHALLLRAGYIKQVSNGIYSFLPPAKRVEKKIENIIREEMDKIGGQEVLFPVLMPRELWEESGRYFSIGDEMVRFKDRTGHDMLLGMTHEEAAVHMCKNTVKSYDQLPFMIYQIQTKIRDEARSRAGLFRVREFTMKDAYSFHMSKEDMEEYYKKCYQAYVNIFTRIGLKDFIAVKSDSGMMGGSLCHEFMLLTDVGEDTLVVCPNCDYKANIEVATGVLDGYAKEEGKIEEVFTGEKHTIAEICESLFVEPQATCKAVSYAVKGDNNKSVLVFIRGDLDVNETKLNNLLGIEVVANDLTDSELTAGNIGPYNLSVHGTTVVFDKSLESAVNVVCGANKPNYHLKGVSIPRDVKPKEYFDVANVKSGMGCPVCGCGLRVKNGIEIGHIFQLGSKYTKSMNMTIHSENGEDINPLMACYGIGVGRAIASVAEESSDEKGLVWPVSIAPWHVYLCPLRLDDEKVRTATEHLLSELEKSGVEVLFDDRNLSAGVKFAESELMGIPFRIVVSPRSLENGQIELNIRESGGKIMLQQEEVVAKIKQLINAGIHYYKINA